MSEALDRRRNPPHPDREAGLLREVLHQCGILEDELEAAEAWLADRNGKIPDPAWFESTAGLLERVRDQIVRLFDLQESDGGYFSVVLERRPDEEPRLEQLRRQHLSILRQLEDLVGRFAQGDEKGAPKLLKNLSAFLVSLRTQQSIERSLLQGTYYRDEGAVD